MRGHMLSDHKHSMFYRCGASAARGTHNSEVTGSTPVAGIIHFASFIVLPHNPPATSWGDKNLVVQLDVKRSYCYTGVAQRKRAVKHRPLPLYHLWYDLRMVMAYTPEDVGSKPTTGILLFFFIIFLSS